MKQKEKWQAKVQQSRDDVSGASNVQALKNDPCRKSRQEQKQIGHENAAETANERSLPREFVGLMKSTLDQDEPCSACPADAQKGEGDSRKRRADCLFVSAV